MIKVNIELVQDFVTENITWRRQFQRSDCAHKLLPATPLPGINNTPPVRRVKNRTLQIGDKTYDINSTHFEWLMLLTVLLIKLGDPSSRFT